jgi:two-component system, NarL family, response regulator DesR
LLEDGIEVVAELDRGDEIVSTAMRIQPDVAVLDVDVPGHDGLTAAEQLHEQPPQCRTLVLTGLGGFKGSAQLLGEPMTVGSAI